MSQEDVGTLTGKTGKAVSQWETGRTYPSREAWQKLSDAFKVGIDQVTPPLPGGALAVQQENPLEPIFVEVEKESFIGVAVVPQLASAGYGAAILNERPDHHVMFREQWLKRFTNSFRRLMVLEVSGESMHPALYDGDHALVDMGQTNITRDALYVLDYGRELQVKRLSIHPTTRAVTVASDNPAFPTYADLNSEELYIVGRVVWLGRRV